MANTAVEMLHGIVWNKNISKKIKKNTKSYIFWDMMQCCPLKIQPVFRRNASSPSSGPKNKPGKETSVQQESGSKIYYSNFNPN
jgi:hypothetical protein